MARWIGIAVIATGAVAFAGVIVLPAMALMGSALLEACLAPPRVPVPSTRQWGLIGRTVMLAFCGTALALALALPGAWSLVRMRRFHQAPLIGTLVFLPLLVPPMIAVFGWQRLLGGYWFREWSPMARCVWSWASWGWPIPAAMMAAGWSGAGRSAYEAALLVASPGRALLHAAIPAVRRHVVVSATILFVWFIGEYSVPHANGVFVIASELMDTAGEAGAGESAVRMLGSCWPLVAVVVAGIAGAARWWPATDAARPDAGVNIATGSRLWSSAPVVILATVTCLLPLGAVAGRRTLADEVAEMVTTYGPELLGSMWICAVSGGLTVIMGMAMTTGRALLGIGMFGTFLFGVVPGAVVGSALLAAYRPAEWMEVHPRLADTALWVYGHWPILLVGMTGRFAWVGWLACRLALRGVPRACQEQSRLDGGGGALQTIDACWRHQWPILVFGAAAAAAMAMSEFTVVGILGVPSPTMAATIVIEKFHRFEYGMLSALCVCLMVGAIPGAILMWAVLRRWA